MTGKINCGVLERLLLMDGGHTKRFNNNCIKKQQKIEPQQVQMYGIG